MPGTRRRLVQGHALGGGAGLRRLLRHRVAHERAVFAFSEVKLGIIPAVISPFALRKIGESAARRYSSRVSVSTRQPRSGSASSTR